MAQKIANIRRRLPLFDVQIFTMPHRACLRGSRRCVGVLFASCSLCVSFRKFKIAVSILCSIYITFIFIKKQEFIWKSSRLSSETPRIPVRVPSLKSSSDFSSTISQRKFSQYFRWINSTDSYQQMRGKYACLNSKVDCSVFFLLRKRERERERKREKNDVFFNFIQKML